MPVSVRGGRTGLKRAEIDTKLSESSGPAESLAPAALHRLVVWRRIAGGGIERDFIDVDLRHWLGQPQQVQPPSE